MPSFRYQVLADQIIQRIQSGVYPQEQKLPSIRQLSQELNISKGTAVRCYEYLEDQGWIIAKEKSGFFPHPSATVSAESISGPATAALRNKPALSPQQKEKLQPRLIDNKSLGIQVVRSASHRDQISLGSADPCVSFPAVRQLYQSLKKQVQIEQQELDSGILAHYQAPPGDPILGQQLSQILSAKGIRCASDEILVTNGTQSAITLALQITTETEDIVLIESPCFYGTLQCLQALNRKVVEIPQCPEGGPDINLLEAALIEGKKSNWPVKALLLQPTVNNPTGHTMPYENRMRLIKLANQYDIAVIEDDVFAELHFHRNHPQITHASQFQGIMPPPIKALDSENRVLYCGSISKILTPKLRIGWLQAGRWQQACEHLLFVSKMGLPSHTQRALGNWLATGRLNRHLRLIRRSYYERFGYLEQALAQYWPEEIEFEPPTGGYLAWVKLPRHVKALDLYQQALEHNINTTPGPLFSSQGHYEHYIRLNFALFQNQPEYLAAIQYLGDTIRTLSKQG